MLQNNTIKSNKKIKNNKTQLHVINVKNQNQNQNIVNEKCINICTLTNNNKKIIRQVYNPSNISNTNLSYNNIKPSSVEVDRTFYLTIKYYITLNGNAQPGGNIMDSWGYDIAPRCMFINNSFSKISLQLNNQIFTQNKNSILGIEERIKWKSSQSYLSESCTVADQSQLYSELVESNRNPLGGIQYSEPDQVTARGGFNGIEVLTNTPTSATFYLTGTEPIMISPLIWKNLLKKPFIHLNNINFNGIFDNDLCSRVLSISDSNPDMLTCTISPISSTLNLTFYNVQPTTPITKSLSYSYYQYNQITINNTTPLQSNGTAELTINDIIIHPNTKYIYIYVKQTNYNIRTTNTFARINNLSITSINNISVLNSISPHQLYQISIKNGIELTWDQWYGSTSGLRRNTSGVGSILCISPVIDLGIKSSNITKISITINYTSLIPNYVLTPITYSAYAFSVDKYSYLIQQ